MDPSTTPFDLAIFTLPPYALLALIAAVSWALGRRLTRRVPFRDDLEATVLSTTIGLGALATALMLLALAGLFTPTWIGLLIAATQVVSWRSWREEFPKLFEWLGRKGSVAVALAAIITAAALSPLLILPLYPPVEFDATLFHLPFARAIQEAHGIEFFEQLRYPVFPALADVLFALALTIEGDLLAALVHLLCFVLVALLIFHWGRLKSSPRAGYMAALVWLATPTAVYAGTSAYVDCALALFVTAALFCMERHWKTEQLAWLMAAGCCVAFAAATKYHGLFFAGVYVMYVAVWAARKRRVRQALAALGIAVLLASPWYGHIVMRTGNPIFPFAERTFGWSDWAFNLVDSPELESTDGGFERRTVGDLAVQHPWSSTRFWVAISSLTLKHFPTHLVELFTHPENMGGRPLSPLLFLLAPAALGLAIRSRTARWLFLILVAYLVFWNMVARDARYLLPVVPIWSLLGCVGLDRAIRWLSPGRWMDVGHLVGVSLSLLVLAVASSNLAEMVWKNRLLPMAPKTRQAFVVWRHPEASALFAFNELADDETRLYGLFAEKLRFHNTAVQVGDWFGPNRFATVMAMMRRPDALHAFLEELEIDYLFYPRPTMSGRRSVGKWGLPPASSLASHFELVYAGSHAGLLRLRRPEEIEVLARESQDATNRTQ